MSRSFIRVALACAALFALGVPQVAKSSPAPKISPVRALYLRAIATMSAQKAPPFVMFRLVSQSDGLEGDLDQRRCDPCIHFGRAIDHWLLARGRNDAMTRIVDLADGSHYLSPEPLFDPTWNGAFVALRDGMIDQLNAYKVPGRSLSQGEPTPLPSSAPLRPVAGLKTIAAVQVIGPGIYHLADEGDAACPNGDPGHAIHLWSRVLNPRHMLTDVIVDLQTNAFCMIRFGLRAPGPMGGNAVWEEHFANVGGYWLETEGIVSGTSRIFGIDAGHGKWIYHLSGMRFPPSLPPFAVTTFVPKPFDTAPYEHADRLVNIGGRNLNLYCTGAGAPTVLLDAAGGDDMLDWRYVQPLLAARTRVCSYDRAGHGFSDPGPLPRSAGALADDVHALVRRAGIAPPFVLVGYSTSALSARLYADRYRNDLAGLVLVGPGIEDQAPNLLKVAPGLAPYFAQGAANGKLCAAAAARGAIRPNTDDYDACVGPPDPSLPAAVNAAQTQQELRPLAWADSYSEEVSDATVSTSQVHSEQKMYGALPLVIVTAADVLPAKTLPASQQRAERAFMQKMRAPLLTYSSRASSIVVNGCSHGDITVRCAPAVASAILDLVKQARGNAP